MHLASDLLICSCYVHSHGLTKLTSGELLLRSLPGDVEESKPAEGKADQNWASADVESHCYQVDSCLESMDVDNDTESNLKLLSGSLEEKEEIGIGKTDR